MITSIYPDTNGLSETKIVVYLREDGTKQLIDLSVRIIDTSAGPCPSTLN